MIKLFHKMITNEYLFGQQFLSALLMAYCLAEPVIFLPGRPDAQRQIR